MSDAIDTTASRPRPNGNAVVHREPGLLAHAAIGAMGAVAAGGSLAGAVLSGQSVEQVLYIIFGVAALISIGLVLWSAHRYG